MQCEKNSIQEILRAVIFSLEKRLIGEELWILVSLLLILLFSFYGFLLNQRRIEGKIFGYMFFLLGLLTVLIAQIPNFARYAVHVNECQHIAEAYKLSINPIFWKSVDGTTIGPIPIYLLSGLSRIGISIDYFSAKILNALVWFLIVCIHYKIFKIEFDALFSKILILPFFALIACFNHQDFIAYNGEAATILLLSISLYLILKSIREGQGDIIRDVFLGIILILVPFSKIQAGPIAVYFGVFYLIWSIRKSHTIIPVLFGVSIPILLIAYYLWYNELFKDFFQSYILNNLFYTGKGEGLSNNKGLVNNFIKVFFILFKGIELRLFVLASSIILLYTGIIAFDRYQSFKSLLISFLKNHKMILLIGYLFLSFFVIYIPGNVFLHYALFLLSPLVVLLVFSYRYIKTTRPVKGMIPIYMIVFVLIPTFNTLFQGNLAFEDIISESKGDQSDQVKRYLCENKRNTDLLALWGWESELYSDTGLLMATRESQTQRQMLSWKQKDYYFNRYIDDLEKAKPRFFIDSTVKNSHLLDSTHHYSNYPELMILLEREYKFVMKSNGMSLFERK